MKKILLFGVVMSVAFLAASFLVVPDAKAINAEERQDARLHGSFLQLLKSHKDWQEDDWARLFDSFKALKLSHVVVQWIALDDTEFYLPKNNDVAADTAIDLILRQADQAGLKVLVGLKHEPQFWTEITRPALQVKEYLEKREFDSLAIADRMSNRLKSHISFEGWYLTEEIDDINWHDAKARTALFNYLAALAKHLHALTPNTRVAVSGFSNGTIRPEELESFWFDLLQAARDVDVVLFQDGIGTGKLDLARIPLYLGAIANAAKRESRQLRIVTEIFRQVSGPPLNDEKFRAEPAPMERIQSQIRAELPLGSQLVAFSVPEYMSPFGGLSAARLFEEYLTSH